MRTVAIALDGCSWNILEPLIDTGELPHLAGLRERGASGVLESTVPYSSSSAWASFATGATPSAHGIYDFMRFGREGSPEVVRQSDLRRKTYYQQLGQEGKRSVLINVPLEHHGCDGAVIVNGWLTDEARRILPVGRRDRYGRLLAAYRTFPGTSGDLDELCAIEEARFDLARELFLAERWHHYFVQFSATDWLAHQAAGSFLRGASDARAAFLRLYRQLDRYIGWFLDHAADATTVVLSNHGRCEEEAVFRVNAVLRDLGLVVLQGSGTALDGGGIIGGRDVRPPAVIRVPDALGRLRTNPVMRPIASATKGALRRALRIAVTRPTHAVDRTASRAFSPSDASLGVYAPECTRDEISQIRSALLAVRLGDGRPAVAGVWTPEELYGRADAEAPTLLFSPSVGVRPSALVREDVVSPSPAPGRGCHQRDGIVLMGGPSVRHVALGRRSICDLAPTLLWAMGSKIPSVIDGRVLLDGFDELVAAERPVVATNLAATDVEPRVNGHSEEVARRLKALGYI